MIDDVLAAVMHHFLYWVPKGAKASASGIRVACLLHEWHGLHHFDSKAMKKVDWTNPRFQVVKLSKYEMSGQLSTFDFSQLTQLVFLCHDYGIRVQIGPCNMQNLELMFHPRGSREGGMAERHPTLETAVATWREKHQSFDLTPVVVEGDGQ